MDGILDWYLLGLVAGLGAVVGTAAVGARGHLVYAALGVAATAAAAVVTGVALPWWALGLFAGAALLGRLALRRLAPAALPAALAGATALALLPALGYVLAAATPLVGARLGRRAGSRYAGLRVLAKD